MDVYIYTYTHKQTIASYSKHNPIGSFLIPPLLSIRSLADFKTDCKFINNHNCPRQAYNILVAVSAVGYN